ncbi:hypothetical protein Cni_G02264 [Canna indica]|uniref:Protein kinase domain-containing protein n=1 Tax=Canna indica TaxID=4628 RepID=A0AAQ3Q243_9LILI|nr:hypothetical protein Cni_G02264 [Canna indica]
MRRVLVEAACLASSGHYGIFSKVYKLSIGAACGLSWPLDRLIIQVLGDSTDPEIKNFLFIAKDENAAMKLIDFGLSDFVKPAVVFIDMPAIDFLMRTHLTMPTLTLTLSMKGYDGIPKEIPDPDAKKGPWKQKV